jgi:hypothetical protein
MARTSSITVQSKGEVVPASTETKKIVRRLKEPIQEITPEAIATEEEFNNLYDPSQRLAIFQALIEQQEVIRAFASKQEQIAESLEYARLAAGEDAQKKGRLTARNKFAAKQKQEFRQVQQEFIDVQLNQLIDHCANLSFESMKELIDQAAAMVKVKLEWKTLDDGQFECIPSIID